MIYQFDSGKGDVSLTMVQNKLFVTSVNGRWISKAWMESMTLCF